MKFNYKFYTILIELEGNRYMLSNNKELVPTLDFEHSFKSYKDAKRIAKEYQRTNPKALILICKNTSKVINPVLSIMKSTIREIQEVIKYK